MIAQPNPVLLNMIKLDRRYISFSPKDRNSSVSHFLVLPSSVIFKKSSLVRMERFMFFDYSMEQAQNWTLIEKILLRGWFEHI